MGMRAYHRHQFAKEIILSKHQPPGAFPLVLILDNMKPTFNIGKIIRTANALGIREVHLVGIPIFDLRTARGALRHTRSRRFETFAESYETLKTEGYAFFALAPQADATLGESAFPEKSAFIVGHEEFGLSFDSAKFPDIKKLRIPQFGRVQSLNASIAASISCFEYLRQRNFVPPVQTAAPVVDTLSVSPCHPEVGATTVPA